jgi:hypothetical protein
MLQKSRKHGTGDSDKLPGNGGDAYRYETQLGIA